MEKIWLKNYPPGTPATIDPDSYPSLAAMMQESCYKFAALPAIENLGTVLTYREMLDRSIKLAGCFQHKLHLKKGDRIAIMMPNLLQYPILLLAALHIGLVVVNINPLYTERELTMPLKDSGAKAIVVLANFAEALSKVLKHLHIEHIVITEVGDEFPPFKRFLINNYLKHVKKMVPKTRLLNAIYYRDLCDAKENLPIEPVDIEPSDLAFLQYTGGTTGVPKGVMLTHRNLIANILQCFSWINEGMEEGKETVVTALPLYHIFSLTICCFCFMRLGAKSLLITNPRDMPHFLKHLKKNPFTVLVGVNTLFQEMMRHPEFLDLDFSHVKFTLAGGMPVLKAVADRWEELTHKNIIEGYGLTESSPVVTITPLNVTEFTPTIGLPVPSTDVKIVNDAKEELPIGEVGELLVRGPQVSQGYWQNEDETKESFTPDGWLLTGDIVYMDDKGYIYIVDRKKDMILVSGFNVYSVEVEDVIAKHPGVAEVAVIKKDDPETGEAVRAIIVKKDPLLTEKAIRDFCKTKLTRYKIPKYIEFRSALPKTNVGKISKKDLRD